MMDAMVTVHPDGTRRDDPYPPADQHAPHVDVDNVMLGADCGGLLGRAEPVTDSALTRAPRIDGITLIRRAHAGGVDSRSRRYQQAPEHDLPAVRLDVDRVGDDETSQRKITSDVGKRRSTQDSASRHFPHMTPANHQNRQHPMSTSTQVSGGAG